MSRDAVDDWTFGGLWPYTPGWFDTRDGRMHYIDEGARDGSPVVLVHGNPTWGFLYRDFVAPLTNAGYRVVIPDHLGFGRSDKPGHAELYTVERHAARLDALLESLDLNQVTLVPHDWGGPVGLAWAVAHPHRIAGLFVLNTYAHRPPWKVPIPPPLRLFRAPGIGELVVKGLHLFVRGFVLRAGVAHPERLTAEVRRGYLAPHPTWTSRTAILAFVREIPTDGAGPISDFTAAIESGLHEHFQNTPVAIAWAIRDPAFTPKWLDDLWLKTFPEARVLRLPDAKHYLQEDAHERIVPALLSFLETTNPSHKQSKA